MNIIFAVRKMSTQFLIGANGSETDIQDLPTSFKLIFVTSVLLLVMYTCRQLHSKFHHEQRHNHKAYENEHTDSRTREGNVLEKSLSTAEEKEVKKRRVRKKKPRKQMQENGEVSKDKGKERERTPENCVDDGDQARCGKGRKKTPQRGGPQLEGAIKRGAKDSQIPKVSRPVERDEKCDKRRNEFVVDDGADQDGSVTKHTEKRREDVGSNKAVEQVKDGKGRNKNLTSKCVDESRNDFVKSGTVDEVRDMDNPNRKIVSSDKKEHGVKYDTQENVELVKEIREVKSAVNSFSLRIFENGVGSVWAVDDKTTRRGKTLAGKPHKPLQAHDRADFLEKDFIKHAAKETKYLDELQKQTHPDSEAKREWTENVCRAENSEDFEKRSREDGRWDSGGLFYRARPQWSEDVGLRAMDPSGENREFVQSVVFGDNSDTQSKTQLEVSFKTAEFGSSRQDLQITSEGHVVIDPEVRKRIVHPKYPVRVPEIPLDNLDLNDPSRREYLNYTPGPNVSRVNGLFGRKWEEMMDKKQEKEFTEEDCKDESVAFIRDCPTFMIWGTCHRGQRCQFRHPSFRYLERPKRAPPSPAPKPEPLHEEPKPPNSRSYSAILKKTKSPENVDFVNVALFKEGSSEGSLEEEWPALSSLGNGKSPKSRKLKSAVQNELKVQEPKKVDRTGPVGSTTGQAQIASDQLIAETLQVDEYAKVNDFNQDDYLYPAGHDQELDVNDYYPEQVEDILEDDENSFDASEQGGKLVRVEQSDSFNFSPLIIEGSSDRAGEPDQTELSSTCDICMDRPKDATLICGHRFCYLCALQMRADERVCAICRRCILSVIKTFN